MARLVRFEPLKGNHLQYAAENLLVGRGESTRMVSVTGGWSEGMRERGKLGAGHRTMQVRVEGVEGRCSGLSRGGGTSTFPLSHLCEDSV